MRYLALGVQLVVFAAVWLAFLTLWLVLGFLASDSFLGDLPSRPFFSGLWRTNDGMLAFSGQADFAGTIMGAAFTFLLALLFVMGASRLRFTPVRRAIPDE